MSVKIVSTFIKPVSKTPVVEKQEHGFHRLGNTMHLRIFAYLTSAGIEPSTKVCRRWQHTILGYIPLDASLRKSLLYSTRPREVQRKIDEVYLSLTEKFHGYGWGYSGSGGFYNYLGFKDAHIIAQRILNAPAQKKDLFFLDLGAGHFAWVNATREFLCAKFKTSDHHFHVIGVSGDGPAGDKIEVTDNITTHKISGFKIENLLDELPKFKLNLVNSVEFIVCYWTLQHLVDYIGTLEQAFHLLTPGNGFLFGTEGVDGSNSLNLMKLFGMHSYIANARALGKFPLFALFRDKSPYHFSYGKDAFEYDRQEPLIELIRQVDSYARCTANLQQKRYVADINMPFGGQFYGCTPYVLEKLLGQRPKTVKCPNGKILQTSLFSERSGLQFLKYYLDAIPNKGYDLEFPEMSLTEFCNLSDLL